ncbi:MAG: DUF2130 domain-containing protein [Solirubrobacterales bacterium]|nr:DUF2130 domain-containing protein [Solirubrobacterales bacterium]
MSPDSITCPKCRTEIPLSEAISHQVEERLRAEFKAEKDRLVEEQAQRLADKEAEAEAAIASAREEAAATAELRAAEQISVWMRDLETRVDEQAKLRRDAEERELELRREKRELEKEGESLRLHMERQLDEERTKIATRAAEQADEKWQPKLRERDLQIEQMNKRLEDLQAAADQKRSGLQGEVLEREIEDLLQETFPADEIEPVKSGQRGADVVQLVRWSRGGCGKLLWESKNHKHWSDGWIDKLRTDQQAEKADVAVIVTSALPAGVEHITWVRGVWVCDFASVVPRAIMLRQQLDAIKQARVIDTNRSRVADDVYEYLCGQEAQHYIANIVEPALKMLHELNAERTASERAFNKREKQLQMQIRNIAGYYGSLQGIASGALLPVAALELPPPNEDPGSLALAS